MKALNRFLFRVRSLGRKPQLEDSLSEEIRTHLEMQTEANIATGMSPDDARAAARREFGWVESVKDNYREQSGIRWLEDLWRDVCFGLRQLRKAPGFTLAATLTLALGIGACTAMFSIVNRIVVQPLPYSEPEQLVQLWEDASGDGHQDGTRYNSVAGAVLKGWQDQSATLEGVAAIRETSANLTGTARPVELRGLQVSPNYLHLLRIPVLHGRDFRPEEGQAGEDGVVVLAHASWMKYFGSQTEIVGQRIHLGGKSVVVAGILPPAARLADDVDFLVPFAFDTPGWNRGFAGHVLQAIGRLQPNVTLAQVRAEMAAITERQRDNYPEFKRNWGVTVVPMHEEVTGPIRPQLLLLFGASACMLLVACANVAGLLLARAVSRGREIALRLTLGAGRGTVARQLLTENLLLGLIGGTAGVLLAFWGVNLFERLRPAEFASGLAVALDGRALGFAVALSVLTGLAAGSAPAWRLRRTRFDDLKSGNRSSSAGVHAGVRGALIVGQIAVSLVLLAGTGLLLRSMMRLQSVPMGFDPSGILIADMRVDDTTFNDIGTRVPYLDDIVRQASNLPGVESVGIAFHLPLQRGYTERVRADGTTTPEPLTSVNFVTGRYFETMRIPLLAGRRFEEADNRSEAGTAMVINNLLAKQLFGDENPVGRHIRLLGQTYEVVGVTGDVIVWGAEHGAFPLVYLPEVAAKRFPFRNALSSIVVRTSLPPLSLAKGLQEAVLAVAPDQPISNVRTYDLVTAEREFRRRLMLGLLGCFAVVTLALAAVGMYGIIAFAVDCRTRELGIRSALGASRANLVRLMLSGGLKLTAVGIALGLVGAFFATRLLATFLFEVAPLDPITLASAPIVLAAAGFLACWLPARRATRVDPIVALRND